jgi:membrane protease YdiL (CAAX protease family)
VWRGIDVAIIFAFTLVVMFLALAGTFVVLAIIAEERGQPWATAPRQLTDVRLNVIAQFLAYATGFIVAYLWITRAYGVNFWRATHWTTLPRRAWLPAFIFAGGCTAVLSAVLQKVLPVPKQLPIEKIFTAKNAWLLVVFGTVVAPFYEEFIFRGLLYPTLRRAFSEGMSPEDARSWRTLVRIAMALLVIVLLFIPAVQARRPAALIVLGAAIVVALFAGILMDLVAAGFRLISRLKVANPLAIVVTGVLFGLMHSQQLGGAWSALLIISIVGVLFTIARSYTGTVTASWLMHVAYNFVLFLDLYIVTAGFHHFERVQ